MSNETIEQRLTSWNLEYWGSLNYGQRLKLAVEMQSELVRLEKELAEERLHHDLTVIELNHLTVTSHSGKLSPSSKEIAMTTQKELRNLITSAEAKGAVVTVQIDESDGREIIKTVQVPGLKGVGPHPMSPISAAERLREVLCGA